MVRPDTIDKVLGSFVGQGLGIRNVIRRFSMIGVIAVPARLVPVINDLPGVRAVHADLPMRAGMAGVYFWESCGYSE